MRALGAPGPSRGTGKTCPYKELPDLRRLRSGAALLLVGPRCRPPGQTDPARPRSVRRRAFTRKTFRNLGIKPDYGHAGAWDTGFRRALSAAAPRGPDATAEQVRAYVNSLHGARRRAGSVRLPQRRHCAGIPVDAARLGGVGSGQDGVVSSPAGPEGAKTMTTERALPKNRPFSGPATSGKPIIRNLLKHGYPVAVWNRNAGALCGVCSPRARTAPGTPREVRRCQRTCLIANAHGAGPLGCAVGRAGGDPRRRAADSIFIDHGDETRRATRNGWRAIFRAARRRRARRTRARRRRSGRSRERSRFMVGGQPQTPTSASSLCSRRSAKLVVYCGDAGAGQSPNCVTSSSSR